jgi:hypothetical protein
MDSIARRLVYLGSYIIISIQSSLDIFIDKERVSLCSHQFDSLGDNEVWKEPENVGWFDHIGRLSWSLVFLAN